MTSFNRNSFEGKEVVDLNSIIAEFPEGDDKPGQMIPVMKLSGAFDNCTKEKESQMKVYLRIRPTSSKLATDSTIVVESDNTIMMNAPDSSRRAQYSKLEERKYAFTRVFASKGQQSDLYKHSISPLLDRFFNGENCLLFAYGMSNSGKTYTIQGTPASPGLLPLLVEEILEIGKRMSQRGPNNIWDLQVTILEIYQEKISDLLNDKKEKLIIRDTNGKVEVCKLSSHTVISTENITELLDSAGTRRTTSVGANQGPGSHKSHAVYTLILNRKTTGKGVIFQLVDLAGTERSNKTKASIQQQKESNNINVSLMQLWRCLQGIKKKSTETSISYRDSKLTHLLMPALLVSGLGSVAMVACVCPLVEDYDETLSIIGNASIANKIKETKTLGQSNSSSSSSSEEQKEQKYEKEEQKQQKEQKVLKVKSFLSSAASAILAAAALGKRRRAAATPVVEKKTLKRGITATKTAQNTQNKQDTQSNQNNQNAQNTFNTVVMEEKEKSVETVEKSIEKSNFSPDMNYIATKRVDNVGGEEESDGESESESSSVVKKMRIEISRLQGENEELLNEQLTRETEIRVEVSLEMAMRSVHLLDQLQDLQKQLDGKENEYEKTTKSCKKICKNIRKEQMEKENEEMSRDLEEAEEELERVKLGYEKQINDLMNEKNLLANRLIELKNAKKQSTETVITENEIVELKSEIKSVTKEITENKNSGYSQVKESLVFSSPPPEYDDTYEKSNGNSPVNSLIKSSERNEGNDNNYEHSGEKQEGQISHWNDNMKEILSPFTEELIMPEKISNKLESIPENAPVIVPVIVDHTSEKENSPINVFNIVNIPSAPIPSHSLVITAKEDTPVLTTTTAPDTVIAVVPPPRPSTSAFRAKFRDENDPRNSIRVATTRKSVADEFQERMQRDKRFKNNAPKHVAYLSSSSSSLTELDADPVLRRPLVRSPLSPVRENNNSPVLKVQGPIWAKPKGTDRGPAPPVEISWEKSLRGTDRPLSPQRFDTTADKRSVSPLTRMGRIVDPTQSQLTETVDHPVQPKATFPWSTQAQPQPPLGTTNTLNALTGFPCPPSYSSSPSGFNYSGHAPISIPAVPVFSGRPVSVKVDFSGIPHTNIPSDGSTTPRARAKIVSARRVISTRINHQLPTVVKPGTNPNAGDYVSRLRVRNVR